jgi:hypothetical protein
LASLCLTGSRNVLGATQYLDLNSNQKKDADRTLLAGIAVCESNVYCFQMIDSCCQRPIDATECKRILTDYWTNQPGLISGTTTVQSLLQANAPSGFANGADCQGTAAPMWNTAVAWP